MAGAGACWSGRSALVSSSTGAEGSGVCSGSEATNGASSGAPCGRVGRAVIRTTGTGLGVGVDEPTTPVTVRGDVTGVNTCPAGFKQAVIVVRDSGLTPRSHDVYVVFN